MRRLFRVFDEDNSGTVSYQEFCHVVFPHLDVEALYNSKEVAKNVQMNVITLRGVSESDNFTLSLDDH